MVIFHICQYWFYRHNIPIYDEGVTDDDKEHNIQKQAFYKAMSSQLSKMGENLCLNTKSENKEIIKNRVNSQEENVRNIQEEHPNLYNWLRMYSVLHLAIQEDKLVKKDKEFVEGVTSFQELSVWWSIQSLDWNSNLRSLQGGYILWTLQVWIC